MSTFFPSETVTQAQQRAVFEWQEYKRAALTLGAVQSAADAAETNYRLACEDLMLLLSSTDSAMASPP
jgi:hypothetical protein